MGIVRDVTVDQLTQAVGGIDTSGLVKDSTAQATNTLISNINTTLGGITTNDPPTDTTQQSIASAISGLGQLLGADKANIDGSNIANPSAFRTNLGLKSTLLFGSTGNTIYNNFYYGDIELTFSTSKIYSLIITTTSNNRPAFIQILNDKKLRLWSSTAATDASVKVYYYD